MKEINGLKYYHICTAGEYTQGNITVEFLSQVVRNYNSKFHEAPIWIGHTDFASMTLGVNEPRALSWIDKLYFEGDKLYASFNKIGWELQYLINEEQFKYCSCEFVTYLINETEIPYLYALALTNRPAVFGLEPLKINSENVTDHIINNNFIGTPVYYTNANFKNFNHNQMNEFLKKVALSLGLDLSKFTTDSSLQEAINIKLTEMNTALTDLKAKDPIVDPNKDADKFAALEAQIKKLQDDNEGNIATSLADTAMSQFKITPAQRDGIVAFAKSNYEAAKKYVDELPVVPALAAQKISGAVPNTGTFNLDDAKFKKEDGKKIKFSDVISNPELIVRFSDDELRAMQEEENKETEKMIAR